MNPFELPPTTPPVSFEPPDLPAPRRGRMLVVALASAGLLAGGVVGVVGVSALVSADDPEPDPNFEASEIAVAATGEDETLDDDGAPGESGGPTIDGEITIDLGDGEPIVLDLGELADLDEEELAALAQCAGVPLWLDAGPSFDVPDGEFEFDGDLDRMFEEFEEMIGEWSGDGGFLDDSWFEDGFDGELGGGEITVMGPDGVTIIDLGDGDASVTVSRDGETGELTVTTEGTAAETSLDDLFGAFELLPEQFSLDELELGEFFPEDLDELMQDLPGDFGAFEFDGFDPGLIADCLADLG